MDTSRILNAATIVATGALAIRLYASGLRHRYHAFFGLLILSTLATACILPLSPNGNLYEKIYIVIEPVYWVFYAWAVLEIYSLVLEGYQGLATVGRWALIAAFWISLLSSTGTLLIPHRNLQTTLLSYYPVAERAVYFSLLVFLLAILFILLRYPIVLSRNLVSHAVIYSVYFLFNGAFYTVLSLFGRRYLDAVGYALQAATLMALAAWLVLLKPAGEKRVQPASPAGMPSREAQLIGQLNSLNEALLRAMKK